MNWAQRQRMAFIGTLLSQRGFINRSDLVREFEISIPTASTDLQTYLRQYPGSIQYNSTTKRYEVTT